MSPLHRIWKCLREIDAVEKLNTSRRENPPEATVEPLDDWKPDKKVKMIICEGTAVHITSSCLVDLINVNCKGT